MSSSPLAAARPIRILIVDDMRDNRELLQVMLEWEGFVTQLASSGEEALASVANDPPDVVLLDLGLPGLNGCEVTTQLSADVATKSIPVLIISGRDDDATKKRLLAAGAADFLVKPINRADVCQRVRNALDSEGCSSPALGFTVSGRALQ